MAARTLAADQQAFMTLLLDESSPVPAGWDTKRLAIYRNAYRMRLVDALREIYPRTAAWVREDAFQQAAAHHLITCPPNSWTLDAVGEGFPATLAGLFVRDPEVSELAWLEGAMHRCFVSADAEPMNAAEFAGATAQFLDTDWARLRLQFLPGTQCTRVAHRIDSLWRRLGEPEHETESLPVELSAPAPLACLVWRQGMKPVFRLVPSVEGEAIAMLLGGASYAELCSTLVDQLGEAGAVSEAGAMLGRWLREGMVAGVSKHDSLL